MPEFIHHHTASPYSGGEEDGFDVIETDEISICHRSMRVEHGFATAAEAEERADELAAEFDRQNDPDGSTWLKQQFEYEWCAECGRDHRHHTAVIDPLGNWFARCDREPVLNGDKLVVDPEGYEKDSTITMKPHFISIDFFDIQADEQEPYIAYVEPADPKHVAEVLALPMEGSDNRSPWAWVRLRSGDLLLATFPQGETYERLTHGEGVANF